MNAAAHQIPVSFAPIPNDFINDASLSARSRVAFLALSQHADRETRECWPSIGRLAGMTGMSPETVSKALTELELSGWISRTIRRSQGKWSGFTYTVHWEAHPPGKPDIEPIDNRTGKKTDRLKSERIRLKDLQPQNNTAPVDQVETPEPEASLCVSSPVEEKHEAPPAPEAPRKVAYLVKPRPRKEIDQAVLDSINAQLRDGMASSKIKNPPAYKRTLLQLAERGEYVPPGAQQRNSVDFEKTRQYIQDIDAAREKCSKERDDVLEMLRRFNRKEGGRS